MPGLVAFNRRWDVGSDDLVFPGLVELITRFIWLIAIASVYGVHKPELKGCKSGTFVEIYYIGIIVILFLQCCLALSIICVSKRGSIVFWTPRKRIPILLYLKSALFVPELGWTILGTYWAFTDSNDCEPHVVLMAKLAVIAGWILFVMLFVGLLITFDPLGSKHQVAAAGEEARMAASKKLWETRCKVICCCAAQDEHSRNAFEDIAEMLTEFFQGVDLVATDIAAGLILAQLEQQGKPLRYDLVPWREDPYPVTAAAAAPATDGARAEQVIVDLEGPSSGRPQNGRAPESRPLQQHPQPLPWMNIHLAANYIKFASASYGWPLFIYSNLVTGVCSLCAQCSCSCCGRPKANIVSDNCCNCNTAAILQVTGIKEDDIIYASYYNRVYEIPFFIALDHKHQSIVVSIRGTLSLRDALTDLTAGEECIETGDIQGGQAHKGILRAAKYIHNQLEQLDLLQLAEQRGPNYQLVVTGHSLGAGAAAILSILLKPQYPNIQCFAFSPPGWLLSKDLVRYTEDFVCSVVVGKDIIPRLGLVTMDGLKSDVLQALRESNTPKYKILASGAWFLLCGLPDLETEEESTGTQRHLLSGHGPAQYSSTDNQQHRLLQGPDLFTEQLNSVIARCSEGQCCTHLFMPGQVLFIDEDEPASGCYTMPLYEAHWGRAELFDEILISPKMVSDHMPDTVLKALEQLAEKNIPPRYVLQPRAQNVPRGSS